MTKSIWVVSWPDFLSPGFVSWVEFHLRKCGFSSRVAEYDFLPVNPLIGQPGFPNPWFTYVYMLFIQHEVCPQKKYNNNNKHQKHIQHEVCHQEKNIIIIINTKNTSNMRCATRKKTQKCTPNKPQQQEQNTCCVFQWTIPSGKLT